MAKSSRRNKSEGTLDEIGGRLLQLVGKVTGRRSTQAKGGAARVRGASRKAVGRTKASAKPGGRRTTRRAR